MGRLSDFQLYLATSISKTKPVHKQTSLSSSEQLARSFLADSQPDSNVLDIYNENASLTPASTAPKTPKPAIKTYNRPSKTPLPVLPSPKPSPKIKTTSEKYEGRQDSGSVMKELGALLNEETEIEEKKLCENLVIDYNSIKYPRVMSTDPPTQRNMLHNCMISLSDAMQDLYCFDLTQLTFTTSEEVVGIGRVVCDGDGKLNSKSVLCQTLSGESLPLELDACPNYALFPGQTVAVKGTNPGGGRVFATEIFNGANAPLNVIESAEDSGTLTVFVASGPFMTNDGTSLQPFQDLIHSIRQARPHAIIITGPFLDCRNDKLLASEEPLTQIFEGMMLTLSNLSNDLNVNTFVLPSPREATHWNIYPIRPFSITKFDISKKLHFMPDPCMFSLNGIVFGVTATDSVFHISFQECSRSSSKDSLDRISRLVSHLLQQQSFYPMQPAHNEVAVDLDLMPLYQISVQPHVLVLPSDLSPYVKNVDGCIAVNAGSTVKGQAAGSYGLLYIDLDKSRDKTAIPNDAFYCKIIKM